MRALVSQYFGGTRSGIIQWVDGYTENMVFPSPGKPDGEVERIVVHKPRAKAAVAGVAGMVYGRAKGLLDARRDHANATNRASIVWEKPGAKYGSHTLKTDHLVHLAVDVSISWDDADPDAGVFARQGGRKSATAAAKSIEYGHQGTGAGGPFQQNRWYEGKWILHDAAGIGRKR